MLHRATAFTAPGLADVFEQCVGGSKIFQPFPEQEFGEELQKLADEGKFPYRSEGLAWYKVVEEFVTEWVTEAGIEQVLDDQGQSFYQDIVASTKNQSYQVPTECNQENLVNVLTQFIFNATLYHELVGTIVEYSEKPSHAGFRVLSPGHVERREDGQNFVDLQSYLYSAGITACTGVRMPSLVGKFENYFGAGEGVPLWERKVWDGFQEKIRIQSTKVREANKERRFDCKTFDPAEFECAISL